MSDKHRCPATIGVLRCAYVAGHRGDKHRAINGWTFTSAASIFDAMPPAVREALLKNPDFLVRGGQQ